MIRRLFYRGRHHVRTAPRDEWCDLVTSATIASRLDREARLRRMFGTYALRVEPDVRPFGTAMHRALEEMAIA